MTPAGRFWIGYATVIAILIVIINAPTWGEWVDNPASMISECRK